MINGKKTTTTIESTGTFTSYDDGSIGYLSDIKADTSPAITGQKDAIDIILIVVSTLIIISSFTYLIFV